MGKPSNWKKRDYSKDVPGGAVKNPTRSNPAVRFLAVDREYQNESGYPIKRGSKRGRPEEDVTVVSRRPPKTSGPGFLQRMRNSMTRRRG